MIHLKPYIPVKAFLNLKSKTNKKKIFEPTDLVSNILSVHKLQKVSPDDIIRLNLNWPISSRGMQFSVFVVIDCPKQLQ